MTDSEKLMASSANVDYIAIIKAAKEHNVLHLKIGSFEITMQAAPRDSLSSLSQPLSAPASALLVKSAPNVLHATAPGTSTTSTAEFAAIKSKLEKIHQKRQQFDDFRNLRPPSKEDDSSEGQG